MSSQTHPAPLQDVLPDFCRWPALLLVGIIMQLVVVVVTLAGPADPDVLERFLLATLYLQWIGLCSAGTLCGARRWLRQAPLAIVFPVCWALLSLVTLVISVAAYEVLRLFQDSASPIEPRFSFVLRHVAIGAVVSLLVLRYFWLQHQWRTQVSAEANSRYEALQARMRPHFLFNSLNSIAALVVQRPADAERLVEDLSELMRASLEVRNRLVPLRDELEITRAYLNIEQARLGERLKVEWAIPDDMLDEGVPLLSVQPLVENAVYHGVERREGNSTIRIGAQPRSEGFIIEIANPRVDGAAPARTGLRIALDNVAQRLALIYGERARLELSEEPERFVARLHLPRVNRT
jgi:two-component system, LytTR family, sensor histidine kinase AlgZ